MSETEKKGITVTDRNGVMYNGLIVNYNAGTDITELSEDVYTVDATLIKAVTESTLSMSASALSGEEYLVVYKKDDGTLGRKLYADYGAINVSGEDYYIGDFYCNDISNEGVAYKDATKYLKFLTNEDGTLTDNCIYDAITEWACIERAEIDLLDESYNENKKSYSIAIASPVMAALNGVTYESIKVDELTANLVFSKIELQENLTEDDVKALFPYDISALTRQVELAKLKLEKRNLYSTASIRGLESAYKAACDEFGGTYDPLNTSNVSADKLEQLSDDIQTAIANLKEPEVTVSGYQASVSDNVTLNYVLNIPEALEDKANGGKLMAAVTYADGTTNEIAVQAEDEYFVPVSVAPKEIANEISVTIGDGTFTYSVKEYLESVVNSETATDSEKAVAKSLLNYAGCAQDYFKAKNADANAYLSDTKANENVDSTLADITDDAVKAFDAPTLGDNVSFYGASLTCDYDTSIKMYFKVTDDIANHTFTANGKTVEAVEAADGIYCITYSGISAKNLATAYTFSVDGTSFTYGAYNYIYAALNATEVQSGALTELQNMVKAIYYYAEAAKLA